MRLFPMRLSQAAFVLLIPLVLLAAPARAGLTITPTYDATITSDANGATIISTINSAIQTYQTRFTNNDNVLIYFKEMTGGLGQSYTSFYAPTYSQYRAQLIATKAMGTDSTAFEAALPASGNPVPGNSNSGVLVTSANIRALGFGNYAGGVSDGGATNYDSEISLNTGLTNYSGSTGDPSSKYSLTAVVEHEINEALGLHSALDGTANGAAAPTGNVGTLDFFRYSAPGALSYTTDANATAYFSVDGGNTNLVNFNQNSGGDYHDFQSQAGTPRVQDAFGTPGSSPVLGPVEYTALQDIGYNSQSAAPEASSLAAVGLLALGLGGLLLRARKRKPDAE